MIRPRDGTSTVWLADRERRHAADGSVPPLTIALNAVASWIGVTATPWPNAPLARSIWRQGEIARVAARDRRPRLRHRCRSGLPKPRFCHVAWRIADAFLVDFAEARGRPWPPRRSGSTPRCPRRAASPWPSCRRRRPCTAPWSRVSRPVSLIARRRGDRAVREPGHGGAHLEDGPGLVDRADHRVDEPLGVARRRSPGSRCASYDG